MTYPDIVRLGAWVVLCLASSIASWSQPVEKVPVIYSTDLLHPPDDPDDWVDLATLFALPELDIRGIVLDLGQQQHKEPGEIPVKQMMALTGRQVRYANGLLNPLRYPEDTAEDQFGYAHAGVSLILRALRESQRKVVIITVGSLRDVAAAYNREPKLFEEKLERLYANAGNPGGGPLHWNSRLDPQAYIRMLHSNLPIDWAPCFDGPGTLEDFVAGRWNGGPRNTYWKFRQGEMYENLPAAVQNYFFYGLAPKIAAIDEPIAYLKKKEQDKELKDKVWKSDRNMWSTATLYDAAGRKLYRQGKTWKALRHPETGYEPSAIYEFVPTNVSIDRDLRATLSPASGAQRVRLFRQIDAENYQQAMATSLRGVLEEMPLSSEMER